MTEPNWESGAEIPAMETPPPSTDAPPVATTIPDVTGDPVAVTPPSTVVVSDAATPTETPAPVVKRGRGRPPLSDAEKAERLAANAAKARERRAAKGTPPRAPRVAASNGSTAPAGQLPAGKRRRGRPAKVTAAPVVKLTGEGSMLDEIRRDAAKLRDKIFAAVLTGTL